MCYSRKIELFNDQEAKRSREEKRDNSRQIQSRQIEAKGSEENWDADNKLQSKRESEELSRALQQYSTHKDEIIHKSTDSKTVFWSEFESVISSNQEKPPVEIEKPKYNFLEKIQRKIQLLKEEREKNLNKAPSSEERFLKFKQINAKIEKTPIYLPIRKLIKPNQTELVSLKQHPFTQRLMVPSVTNWYHNTKLSNPHSKIQSQASNRSTRYQTDIISGNISKVSKEGPLFLSRPHSESKLSQANRRDFKLAQFYSQSSRLKTSSRKKRGHHSPQTIHQGMNKYSSVSGLLQQCFQAEKERSTNASIEDLNFFKQPQGYVSCGGYKKPYDFEVKRKKAKSIVTLQTRYIPSRQAMDTMDARNALF